LVSKNIKIKIHKTTILAVVFLYGCQNLVPHIKRITPTEGVLKKGVEENIRPIISNSSPNIIRMVKLRRMRSVRHVPSRERRRMLTESWSRWEDNIKIWLRPYATSWKVTGSIPNEVAGFFN
jgi:hypothetical protein